MSATAVPAGPPLGPAAPSASRLHRRRACPSTSRSADDAAAAHATTCLLYTSPSPRDAHES
eukprot:4729201-Prymnesium_polylepis.1